MGSPILVYRLDAGRLGFIEFQGSKTPHFNAGSRSNNSQPTFFALINFMNKQ